MQRIARIFRSPRGWSPALVLGVLYLHLVLPHAHDRTVPAAAPAAQHAHHGHGPQDHAHKDDAGEHHHGLSAHSDSHHLSRQDQEVEVAPSPILTFRPPAPAATAEMTAFLFAPGREPPPCFRPLPALAGRGPPAAA
jgi:hypothetical protein